MTTNNTNLDVLCNCLRDIDKLVIDTHNKYQNVIDTHLPLIHTATQNTFNVILHLYQNNVQQLYNELIQCYIDSTHTIDIRTWVFALHVLFKLLHDNTGDNPSVSTGTAQYIIWNILTIQYNEYDIYCIELIQYLLCISDSSCNIDTITDIFNTVLRSAAPSTYNNILLVQLCVDIGHYQCQHHGNKLSWDQFQLNLYRNALKCIFTHRNKHVRYILLKYIISDYIDTQLSINGAIELFNELRQQFNNIITVEHGQYKYIELLTHQAQLVAQYSVNIELYEIATLFYVKLTQSQYGALYYNTGIDRFVLQICAIGLVSTVSIVCKQSVYILRLRASTLDQFNNNQLYNSIPYDLTAQQWNILLINYETLDQTSLHLVQSTFNSMEPLLLNVHHDSTIQLYIDIVLDKAIHSDAIPIRAHVIEYCIKSRTDSNNQSLYVLSDQFLSSSLLMFLSQPSVHGEINDGYSAKTDQHAYIGEQLVAYYQQYVKHIGDPALQRQFVLDILNVLSTQYTSSKANAQMIRIVSCVDTLILFNRDNIHVWSQYVDSVLYKASGRYRRYIIPHIIHIIVCHTDFNHTPILQLMSVVYDLYGIDQSMFWPYSAMHTQIIQLLLQHYTIEQCHQFINEETTGHTNIVGFTYSRFIAYTDRMCGTLYVLFSVSIPTDTLLQLLGTVLNDIEICTEHLSYTAPNDQLITSLRDQCTVLINIFDCSSVVVCQTLCQWLNDAIHNTTILLPTTQHIGVLDTILLSVKHTSNSAQVQQISNIIHNHVLCVIQNISNEFGNAVTPFSQLLNLFCINTYIQQCMDPSDSINYIELHHYIQSLQLGNKSASNMLTHSDGTLWHLLQDQFNRYRFSALCTLLQKLIPSSIDAIDINELFDYYIDNVSHAMSNYLSHSISCVHVLLPYYIKQYKHTHTEFQLNRHISYIIDSVWQSLYDLEVLQLKPLSQFLALIFDHSIVSCHCVHDTGNGALHKYLVKLLKIKTKQPLFIYYITTYLSIAIQHRIDTAQYYIELLVQLVSTHMMAIDEAELVVDKLQAVRFAHVTHTLSAIQFQTTVNTYNQCKFLNQCNIHGGRPESLVRASVLLLLDNIMQQPRTKQTTEFINSMLSHILQQKVLYDIRSDSHGIGSIDYVRRIYLWQCMGVLSRSFNKHILPTEQYRYESDQQQKLFTLLNDRLWNQWNLVEIPNMRFVIEVVLIQLCITQPQLLYAHVINKMTHEVNVRPTLCASLTIILCSTYLNVSSVWQNQLYNDVLNALVPSLASNYGHLRLVAQYYFYYIIKQSNQLSPTPIPIDPTLHQLYTYLDTCHDIQKLRERQHTYFTVFNPVQYTTVSGIMCNEYDTLYFIPIHLLDQMKVFVSEYLSELRLCYDDLHEPVTSDNARGEYEDIPNATNNEHTAILPPLTTYQRKIEPAPLRLLDNLNDAIISTSDSKDTVDDLVEHTSSTVQSTHTKYPLIVIASLLDKVYNIAGLTRTCEIFGVQQLIVNDINIINDTEYQSVAVTAHKWLDIKQIQSINNSLINYCMYMKTHGYTIVAVEQTSSSVNVMDYQFHTKSILLLGAEKQGIPIDLLHVVDQCVEIPQLGVIRSLNVHVAGSIVMYQYVHQQLKQQQNV